MQIPLTLEQNDEAAAGFRLQRFEVLNWGTFDKYPWAIELQGETALLTGINGSGKSTLVDGLLTLLVPSRRRNYNQASGDSGKKERDEKSYVQGAYGTASDEDSYAPKSKKLREKGHLTVLVAYFQDRLLGQSVTIAEVLWIEDNAVRKFFVIADTELKIATHFARSPQISDLKKYLKANNAEIFDEFNKYSQQFRKRVGLRSEQALNLFNQTVSAKEIKGLNDFVRNHMLEKVDVRLKIDNLQKNYENLSICYTNIQNARKQLEVLQPLSVEAEKYQQLKSDGASLIEFQSLIHTFFTSKKLNLLIRELQQIDRQLTQKRQERTQVDELLANLRQQSQQLAISIGQDSVGQRLQELDRQIEQYQKEVARKKLQAVEYDRLAQGLNLSQYSDRATFYAEIAKGESLKQEIESTLQSLETRRDEYKLRREELNKQKTEQDDELNSLRSRKSQIPKKNLVVRDNIASALNLDSSDLPFIGELLQVRPEEKEWEGAIERLLQSFGLSILVAEKHYIDVNAYVNRINLGGRLVYYRVSSTSSSPLQRPLDPKQIPHKLAIKQENEIFARWLQARLRDFDYICCGTIEQFQRENRAITHQGLIKHGGERHDKNDLHRIDDRSKYILGWDNTDKIKALEVELNRLNTQIREIDEKVTSLECERKQQEQKKSSLRDFLKFADFAEIDWRTPELECVRLEQERKQLEASSDRLKQLEHQLRETNSNIDLADENRDGLIGEIKILEGQQANYLGQEESCKEELISVVESDLEVFQREMAAKLRKYEMTLISIDRDEQDLNSRFQEQIRQVEKQKSESQNLLVIGMLNFKRAFPETTSELLNSLDYLDEYLKLKSQIELDDLPQHEQRFRQLMNDKVIADISMFKIDLENQEEQIKDSIDELNQSLVKINYTSSTYIKLCYKSNSHHQIRELKEDLKSCLGDAGRQDPQNLEAVFKNIQTRLIEKFKSDDKWTNFVIDVRNWLEFSVSECYRLDDSQKEYHTDSSGKSGGQKVKLAYTILASAMAYQYGLNQDDAKSKSFRLVVIDEIFSVLDEGNARYAMELFKNLNLQLLFVTPTQKINVVEPYIRSVHLVSNTPEGNCSSIASIPIEQYRHDRKLAMDSNYDRSHSN